MYYGITQINSEKKYLEKFMWTWTNILRIVFGFAAYSRFRKREKKMLFTSFLTQNI